MLNELLFKAMTHVFGQVPKIVNEGSAAAVEYPPPTVGYIPTVTRIKTKSIEGGEQYAVNCPFCGDRKQRLYISHMWNATIPVGIQTYVCSDGLMNCFNEQCLRDPKNREWVCKSLKKALGSPVILNAVDIKQVDHDADLSEIETQTPLPPNIADIMHPSVPDYIREYWFNVREFTPETLRKFGVKIAYMPHPIKSGAPLMQQPVTIIPVFQYGKLWWYQARLIPIDGDPNKGYEKDQLGDEYPKYYIPRGSKKRWTFYNLDNARKEQEVCIVEGPTDVWRIGNRGMAKFGRSLSIAQRGILERNFQGKTIYLIPDQDDPLAWEEGLKDLTILQNTGKFRKVEMIQLPAGTDPGDLKGKEDEVWSTLMVHGYSPDTVLDTLSGIPVSL